MRHILENNSKAAKSIKSLYQNVDFFQTDEAKKIIRNYNKIAAVLTEYEVSKDFQHLS